MDNEQKLLLTVAEAAVLMGIGRSATYRLVMRGEIPSIKIGRTRRVPLAAIKEFIAEQLQYSDDAVGG